MRTTNRVQNPDHKKQTMDNKSSTTLLLLLASSLLVLTLFISTVIYLIKQPQLQFIWVFSASHPLLALNLLILLIIISSRCFAISRNSNSSDHIGDRDELMLLDDSIPSGPSSRGHQPALTTDLIAERRKSRSTKKGTLESKLKKTKEGSHLRQLEHSHKATEDGIRPPEMVADDTSTGSSGSASLSSAKLRREVSLTKEEVNRRVERFIRKFNDD